ncbi:hypothetical protein AGDE_12952 [Angomonas deanei]|uniref:Uncharacterized protein n=1 Tax=Angomonas deanei TaxID=59799 RepID=A0A7G2CH70_9TRYP|nr:hypothetical protein AGDE_12952 [Angomonas deanei]CAD2218695.1 hypothetical protein, conserved [Angomonas deanei]|eukprot:EPY23199.1 hypothetical protein AGDE_12952 [Angomonas deanei]
MQIYFICLFVWKPYPVHTHRFTYYKISLFTFSLLLSSFPPLVYVLTMSSFSATQFGSSKSTTPQSAFGEAAQPRGFDSAFDKAGPASGGFKSAFGGDAAPSAFGSAFDKAGPASGGFKSAFGGDAAPSAFGSAFDKAAPASGGFKSAFGGDAAPSSGFGGAFPKAAPTPSSSKSAFGGDAAPSSGFGGAFAKAAPAPSGLKSVFGQDATKPTAPTGSLFGAPQPTGASESAFGKDAFGTPKSGGVFGQPAAKSSEQGAANPSLSNQGAAKPTAGEPPAAKETGATAFPGSEWRCKVCNKTKDLHGDHLKGKTEVRSDCWPCAKKQTFVLTDDSKPAAQTSTGASSSPDNSAKSSSPFKTDFGQGAVKPSLSNQGAAKPTAGEPPAAKETGATAFPGLEWRCKVCNKTKDLHGDHLKGKTEVRSDCWPCAKKQTFVLTDDSKPTEPSIKPSPSPFTANNAESAPKPVNAAASPEVQGNTSHKTLEFETPKIPEEVFEHLYYLCRPNAKSSVNMQEIKDLITTTVGELLSQHARKVEQDLRECQGSLSSIESLQARVANLEEKLSGGKK